MPQCYLNPQSQTAHLMKAIAGTDLDMQLFGYMLATYPPHDFIAEPPMVLMRYVFGPIVVHTTKSKGKTYTEGTDWLPASKIRERKPQVQLERLEILCGERPDMVSPTEIWLVMNNATHDAPPSFRLSSIYCWAAVRSMIARGDADKVPSELHPENRLFSHMAVPRDEDVFDPIGVYHHDYVMVCSEIIRKVGQHSGIKRGVRHAGMVADAMAKVFAEAE